MTNIQSLPDIVLWDWDGTLMDSYGFLNDAHNQTLIKLGFEPFKEGEYKQYFGMPREVLYPAIYKEKHEEAKMLFVDIVTQNADKARPIEGAEQVLNFFKKQNIPMGVVSNKKAELILLEKKHIGWEHFFDILVGAGDAQDDKPSAAPIHLALEKMNTKSEKHHIWYMGDTENDLAAAKNAHCECVFLKGHTNTENLIQQYKPLLTFEKYDELHEILVAISSNSSKNEAKS